MISSMTGYGKGNATIGNLVAEAEIKSFNSRFLDISVRIPRKLANKEIEIRNLFKEKIKRGKNNLSVQITKEGVDEDFIQLNEDDLQNTVKLITHIKDCAKLEGSVTLDHVLAFQNTFLNQGKNDSDEEFEVAVQAVISAIDDLRQMRSKEGEELAVDLLTRIDNIEATVQQIEKDSRNSIDEYFSKLRERAKQLIDDISNFDDRLNIELALLAEKYDVTEEFVRLKSHLKLFRSTVNGSAEAGRKLNFILQEMNREVNTINSKTVSSEIAHQGIFMKEEIEKLREQIQNIE